MVGSRWWVLGAVALASAGCSGNRVDVEDQWNRTMALYGLTGLFPLSEDLQPGDIMLDIEPRDMGPQPSLRRLGSMPIDELRRRLSEREGRRLLLQVPAAAPADDATGEPRATTNVTTTATAPGTASITTTTTLLPAAPPPAGRATPAAPTAQRRPQAARPPETARPPALTSPILADPDVLAADTPQRAASRPRMVAAAMPGSVVANVYEGQIAGGGQSGAFSLGGVLGARGAAVLSIRLLNLEMLDFDALVAMDTYERGLVRWIAENRMTPARLIFLVASANPSEAARVCRGERPATGSDAPAIRVVNRVMYARRIEYEYLRQTEVSGRFAAQIARSLAERAALPAVPATPPNLAAPSDSGTRSSEGRAAAAQVATAEQQRLNTLASSLSLPAAPGGQASFGIGTFGNLSLISDFRRPMAVGYNALLSRSILGSLVPMHGDPQKNDQELIALRRVCRDLLTSRGEDARALALDAQGSGRGDSAISLVEGEACDNMRYFVDMYSSNIGIPEVCARRAPASGASLIPAASRLRPRSM